jgi:hypothetical protein
MLELIMLKEPDTSDIEIQPPTLAVEPYIELWSIVNFFIFDFFAINIFIVMYFVLNLQT